MVRLWVGAVFCTKPQTLWNNNCPCLLWGTVEAARLSHLKFLLASFSFEEFSKCFLKSLLNLLHQVTLIITFTYPTTAFYWLSDLVHLKGLSSLENPFLSTLLGSYRSIECSSHGNHGELWRPALYYKNNSLIWMGTVHCFTSTCGGAAGDFYT